MLNCWLWKVEDGPWASERMECSSRSWTKVEAKRGNRHSSGTFRGSVALPTLCPQPTKLQTPSLQKLESMFVLFQATEFQALSYGSPRKLIQPQRGWKAILREVKKVLGITMVCEPLKLNPTLQNLIPHYLILWQLGKNILKDSFKEMIMNEKRVVKQPFFGKHCQWKTDSNNEARCLLLWRPSLIIINRQGREVLVYILHSNNQVRHPKKSLKTTSLYRYSNLYLLV